MIGDEILMLLWKISGMVGVRRFKPVDFLEFDDGTTGHGMSPSNFQLIHLQFLILEIAISEAIPFFFEQTFISNFELRFLDFF